MEQKEFSVDQFALYDLATKTARDKKMCFNLRITSGAVQDVQDDNICSTKEEKIS